MTISTSDRFSLVGRVAFIAGGSGAIGTHFAEVLHEAGANVVLAARRTDLIRDTAERLGTRATFVELDIGSEASVAAALDAAEQAFGLCDVVVNAAGIAVSGPLLDQSTADWDRVMEVNLRGAWLVAQSAARRLVAARKPGSIVNIASILGERVIAGVPAYAASKAGLIHLTRAMALELARHAIRVNALAPGYIATDINAAFFASEGGKALVRRIPQRRLGSLDDLTGPLLLLTSGAGAHMTGTVVTVDGGHTVSSL